MVNLPIARRICSLKGTSAEVILAKDEELGPSSSLPQHYRMFALVGSPLATQQLVDACREIFDANGDDESIIFKKPLTANCYEIVGFFVSPETDYADIFSTLVDLYREDDLLPSSHVFTGEELYLRHPSWLTSSLRDNHNVVIALKDQE